MLETAFRLFRSFVHSNLIRHCDSCFVIHVIRDRTMKIGTYYYPEQWPREEWERDFDASRRWGCKSFTWPNSPGSQWSRAKGSIQFEWLDDAWKWRQGASSTSSSARRPPRPPVWLVEEHPDSLLADIQGAAGALAGDGIIRPAPARCESHTTDRHGVAEQWKSSVDHWMADR